MDLLIKGPDGRVIACPRHMTTTVVIDEAPVTSVNVEALKPGWSVFTPAPAPIATNDAAPVAPAAPADDAWGEEK